MAISAAETLQTVAEACATVADKANDLADTTPYTLKAIAKKGKSHFRFVQVVEINGQKIEVQVRPIA